MDISRCIDAIENAARFPFLDVKCTDPEAPLPIDLAVIVGNALAALVGIRDITKPTTDGVEELDAGIEGQEKGPACGEDERTED